MANSSLYLAPGATYPVGPNTNVFGGTGSETISIAAGTVGIVVDQNVEGLVFTGAASAYTFSQTGNILNVFSGGVLMAAVPLQGDANGTQFTFAGATYNGLLTAGVMSLGGSTVSATAGAVTPGGATPTVAPTTAPTSAPTTAPTSAPTNPISLTAGAASANEGTTATFALANGVANTSYSYAIAGVEAADVVGGVLSGVATTNASGVATISVALVADRLTEGAQSLTVSLPNTTLTATVVVNDTSLNNVAPTAAAATASAAEKGAAVTGQLVATDVDGDALTYSWANDVVGLTINANGSFSFNPAVNPVASALKYSDAAASIVANFVATDALGLTATSTLTIAVTPDALTFKIKADKASAEEGATTVYTVEASEALATDMNVEFTLVPGNGTAVNTGTVTTNTADFATGAFNPTTVVIAATKTTAAFNVVAVNDANTELQESYSVSAAVNGSALTLGGKVVDSTASGGVGQTFMLTTGVDTIPGLVGNAASAGTDGNDIIVALLDSVTAANSTLNALDQVNGGLGTNTMTLNAVGAATIIPAGVTISNVQTMNLRGSANLGTVGVDATGAAASDEVASVAFDVSAITGLTAMNVTLGTSAAVKAAATTDVSVSGVIGGIEVNGGKAVTVTDATVDKNISVGSVVLAGTGNGIVHTLGTAAAGAITVTDTKQGSGVFQIDGGTAVTVTATSTTATGAIKVGALKAASGAVKVTQNLNDDGSGLNNATSHKISVTGGSTVDVTVNANSTATAAGKSGALAIGEVVVLGDGKTTTVNATQTKATTVFTTPVVVAVVATQTVTFKALAIGESTALTHGGATLTFTASKALTKAEVAQAFADLANSDLQDNQGPVANGTYSGTFAAAWKSTSVSGEVVTFTASAFGTTTLTAAGGVAPTVGTLVVGTAGSGGVATTNAIAYGAVDVQDNTVAAITSVTVNGFASANLGVSATAADTLLDALTTLSLANNTAGGDVTLATAATALNLTVNNITGGNTAVVNLDHDGNTTPAGSTTVKTLTINTTGANSAFALQAAALEGLTVAGDKAVDVTGAATTLTALKTVTVTGSAGLTIDASGTNVTAVTTSGTTGAVTATLDGAKATYTGGEGVDTVTLTATTVAKAITLGGGNDKLDGAAATLTGTFTADGGTGTNTLVLDDAQAASLAVTGTFGGKISNFQKLSLQSVATTVKSDVNLTNLDGISYVITAGSFDSAQVKTLTLTVGTAIAAGDKVSLAINGTTYTTAALLLAATADDIGAALVTAVGAAYTVANAAGVLTITSATGAISTLSGLAVSTGTGTVTGLEVVTSSQLTLTNMANAGTVELTAAGVDTVVVMTDASGSADSLNILTVDLAAVNVGTVTANGVETINVTTTDTLTDPEVNSVATLAVKSDKVMIVNVFGAGDITLAASDATLTMIDGSSMAGKLTNIASVASLTVKGGLTGDALSAAANDVKLYGGAGADTLTVTSGLRVNLYGEAGADTFVIGAGASATLDAYAAINGVASGDVIKLTAASSFKQAAISLSVGADETLLNYANQAVKIVAEGEMGWFQKGGNTYIVQDVTYVGAGVNSDAFTAGEDMIVMITGLVNLSTASYNSTSNTLEIA